MVLFHISLTPVQEFSPRIPKFTAPGEDKTIKRVCFSDSILNCINAVTGQAAPILTLKRLGIVPCLYVYTYRYDSLRQEVMTTDAVSQYVPDAKLNQEYWIIEKPEVNLQVYHVEDLQVVLREDRYMETMYIVEDIKLKAVDFSGISENEVHLVEKFDGKEKKSMVNLLHKYGLRDILCHFYEELNEKNRSKQKSA